LEYRPGPNLKSYALGGVRVNKIQTYSDRSIAPITKKYLYSSIQNLNESSGAEAVMPQYYRAFTTQVGRINITSPPSCIEEKCYHESLQSSPINNVNIYPSGVHYEYVTESFGENFENGAIEHKFTTKSDLGPINSMSYFNGDMIPGVSYFNESFYNGLKLEETIFKREGGLNIPVTKTINHYKVDSSRMKDVKGYVVQKRYNHCPISLINPPFSALTSFNANEYKIYSRWVYVDTSTVVNYDVQGNQANTITQVNFYENPTHLQITKSEKINSEGNWDGALYKYSEDYTGITASDNLSLGVKNLINLNVRGPVIESLSYVRKANEQTKNILAGTFNYYKNNLPLLESIWQLELTSPGSATSYSSVASGSLTMSNVYKKQVEFLSYDSRGNILNQRKANGNYMYYLWDYYNNYPILKLNSPLLAAFAYTSFESNGLGNWVITGGSKNSTISFTGATSYNLSTSNSISRTGLSSTTKYILSYWSRNGSLSANGSTAIAISNKNGWTLYRHSIQNATSVSISSIAATSIIDELKLVPLNSEFETYTFEPLTGITSIVDKNENSTHYKYDGLNRLFQVRDGDNNILKQICYNFYGQPAYCNIETVHYNTIQNQSFIKNNCGSNYVGTSVSYIVPANTYASLINVQDANNQALAEIQANGQIKANLEGSCQIKYFNEVQTQVFTRNNCPSGYIGSQVTYAVPANTYYSLVSIAEANQLALNNINQNGQTYANTNGTCTLSGSCTTSNCNGLDKKCIGGVCQTGIKVVTGTTQISTHLYECTYHYEWSDGSWSPNYTEQNPTPCEL
jgi:hypothetical protein